jgi:hypothetical protein
MGDNRAAEQPESRKVRKNPPALPVIVAGTQRWCTFRAAGILQEGRGGMETQWLADRTTLRTLLRTQLSWTLRDFAAAIGRSLSWVKKWVRRLRAAPSEDPASLQSRSRARKRPVLAEKSIRC